MSDLISELIDAKNKSIEPLSAIYQHHKGSTDFISNLLEVLLSNQNLNKEASWIIKHHIESRGALTLDESKKLIQALGKMNNWESQLHILQCIPKITLSKKLVENIEAEVYALLKSERPFVRAGAFEAYDTIVQFIPELENEFRIICEEALIKETASVKVKARRALKRIMKV